MTWLEKTRASSTSKSDLVRVPQRFVGTLGEKLPESLRLSLSTYMAATPEQRVSVHPEFYILRNHVYCLASRGPKTRYGYQWGNAVDLLQIPADNDGEFLEANVASIPCQIAEGREIGELLLEAISDQAWS